MMINDVLKMLRAAGEPSRLRLLALCTYGEFSVGELSQILGQSQPRVSRHLKILCDAGLLERSNEGSSAFFRITLDGPGAELLNRVLPLLPEGDEILVRDRRRLEFVKSIRARRAKAYALRIAGHDDDDRESAADKGRVEQTLRDVVLNHPVQRLLDIGTGTGRILQVLGQNVGVGVGIDSSREMLAVARANLDDAGLHNCRVRYADLYELPFANESFDAVTVQHVLRFVGDPKSAVAEAARVLTPGASLVVVDLALRDRNGQVSSPDQHHFGFMDVDMDFWFRAAGLRPVNSIKVPGSPATVGIWHGVRDRMGAESYS